MITKKAKALLAATPPRPWDVRKVILNSPQLAGALEHEAVCKIATLAPDILAVAIQLAQAHLERPDSEHDGGCSAGFSKLPCKCSQQERTRALAAWAELERKMP